MKPSVMKRVVRGIRWIFHDISLVIKAPKVSVLSKIKLSILYIIYHIFKIDFNKFRVFIDVNGVKYRFISYDELGLAYFELWMDKYLRVKNGEVFIDVGAHVGRYALKVAKANPASLVIAIEPGKLQFNALIDGIRKNNLKNVIPLNIAAWDNAARLKLRVYSATGTSTVVDEFSGIGRLMRIEDVEARPLDDVVEGFGLGRVDWVKIDVEGAELHVLRGFRNGIAKFRPKIIIEIAEFNREGVFNFFREVNYECKHIPEDKSGEYFICAPKS
jgi:FkbM family methyltransferase